MTDDVTMHDVIAHNQVSSFADIRRPAAYCCQDIPPVLQDLTPVLQDILQIPQDVLQVLQDVPALPQDTPPGLQDILQDNPAMPQENPTPYPLLTRRNINLIMKQLREKVHDSSPRLEKPRNLEADAPRIIAPNVDTAADVFLFPSS